MAKYYSLGYLGLELRLPLLRPLLLLPLLLDTLDLEPPGISSYSGLRSALARVATSAMISS